LNGIIAVDAGKFPLGGRISGMGPVTQGSAAEAVAKASQPRAWETNLLEVTMCAEA